MFRAFSPLSRKITFKGFASLLSGSYRNAGVASAVFIEEHPHEQGFSAHYEAYIRPHVSGFEEARMEALEKASFRSKASIPIFILVVVVTLFIVSLSGELDILGLIIVALLILGGWICAPLMKYGSSIKTLIFPNIVSFIEGFDYEPKCADRAHRLKNSDIIPSYDREISEDQVRGAYKGVEVDLFETRLQERRRSKNRTYYVDIFKGVMITLSSNKNFKGKTVVKRDKGAVGNWFKEKASKMDKVTLEDPRFEDMFEVYASDQIEARYLLTTSFMDRLLGLGESFGGKHVECSFYDNVLLMKIAVKRNMFEAGSAFEPEDFVDDAKQLLGDINIIFSIIDTLKLDLDVGL